MFWRFSFVFTILFLALPFVVTGQNLTKCTTPIRDDCTFYTDCLEAKYQCGADGYPIGYGFHFCTKFAESKSILSTAGKRAAGAVTTLPISDWEKVAVDIVGPGTLVESFDALKATASVGVQCTKILC
ncbi:hypothetical protein B0H14DRAFT_3507542 [Mycena olivaceomarginata]|nr:hypothetical protein B0H14DRAFT_3507542 [Mycena olivaceomarginata]